MLLATTVHCRYPFSLVPGSTLGEKGEKNRREQKKIGDPAFFAFFPHCGAWSESNALSVSSYVQWNCLARYLRNLAWKLMRQCEENFCVYEKLKVTRQRQAIVKINT